jgi:hypothetical protein
MTNNYQFTLETPMAVTGARGRSGRKLASVFSTSAPNGNRFEQEDGPTYAVCEQLIEVGYGMHPFH